MLGGRFMIRLVTCTCTSASARAKACAHAQRHAHRLISSLSAQWQQRETNLLCCNLEKGEHEQQQFTMCVFFPPPSLLPGTQKGFKTFILIFTHSLHLSGEARWRLGRVGIGREGKKKNKKIPPNQQPDVLHWRRTRMKLCGILEWATSQPLQRKHHSSSPPRAPAGIRRSPTPAGGLHIWGELSGRGGHVGKHLQLCLKVGLNIRRLWWRKKRREKKCENVLVFF